MRILAIGAHYDDVELNCLGTLLRAKEELGAEVYLCVCTDGSEGGSVKDREGEQEAVSNFIDYKEVIHLDFKDTQLQHGKKLIDAIGEAIKLSNPEYIITHYEDDFHQDHAAVAKAVKSLNRYSEYSVISFPSQDPKQHFPANLYVDISDQFYEKMATLKKFKSQLHRPWFKEEVIKARDVGVGKAKYTEKFNIKSLFI